LNSNKQLLSAGIAGAVSLIAYAPFFLLPLYSIDDYYLYHLTEINIGSLGYNFYSYGRFLQAGLAQIASELDIQPLGRPLGPLMYLLSLLGFGTVSANVLGIRTLQERVLFIILVTTGGFHIEILSYSMVPFYGAFAVAACALALHLSNLAYSRKLIWPAVAAVVSYTAALSTYQIFISMPLITALVVLWGLKNVKEAFYLGSIVAISCVLYTGVTMLIFLVAPPSISVDGMRLEAIDSFAEVGTFLELHAVNYNNFLFTSNPFISRTAIVLLLSVVPAVMIVSGLSNKTVGTLGAVSSALGCYILLVLTSMIVLLGFGVLRPFPGQISGRSFVSFCMVQAAVFAFPLLQSGQLTLPKWGKITVATLAIFTVFINVSKFGIAAFDQYRTNEFDKALAVRIVSRLEQSPDFLPNSVICIIASNTVFGHYPYGGMGTFNISAITHFSRTFLLNEVSGYEFQMPSAEQVAYGEEVSAKMEQWPSAQSILFHAGVFYVRL
jgi:hypothetical protein